MSAPGTGLGQGCTTLCRPARHDFYCGTGTVEGWHLHGMESTAPEVLMAARQVELMAHAIGDVLITRGSMYEAANAALAALDAAGYTLMQPPEPGPCPYCAEPVPEPMAHHFHGWECHDRPSFGDSLTPADNNNSGVSDA